VIWNRRVREQALHRAINTIIEPHRGDSPSHLTSRWREQVGDDGRFAAVGEIELPFEQQFDEVGLVDRVGSISFVAALPDGERGRVLERVRALARDADQPLRLGYTTEAFVYERV
jgi:hypothetical protein